jgi:isocitrate lyase
VRKVHPGQDARLQLLAVVQLEEEPGRRDDRKFQRELGAMGYKFQFITLAGFHS